MTVNFNESSKMPRVSNVEKLISDHGGDDVWAFIPTESSLKCKFCKDSIFEIRFKSRITMHCRGKKHIDNLKVNNLPIILPAYDEEMKDEKA